MTAKAMGDVTLGVNAQLASLTLDSTVLGVVDVRPVNIVSIKNMADQNIEIREADNEAQYPVIVVLTRTDATGAGQVWSGIQDSEIDVECVLVDRGGIAALNFLAVDYYLRSMKKAAHQYLLAAGKDANRVRNGIAIKSAKKVAIGHAQGPLMGGQVAGILKLTFETRDLTP